MKIRPIGSRITVQRDQLPTHSPGGILFVNPTRPASTGTVLDVSLGVVDIKQGDHVAFNAYAGTEITFDDQTILILLSMEVYGHCELS